MNFHQLDCFLTVCAEGTISGAAKKMYVSESSISQIIHKMESELGAELFNRSSRRLALTYAGKQYLKTANKIMQQQRNFLSEISGAHHDISGEFTLSLSEKRVKELLPSVLPKFMDRYPNIAIKIQDVRSPLDIRLKQLLDGTCDLFVSNHKFMHNSVENIPICSEQLALIISKNSPSLQRLFPDGSIPSKLSPELLAGERLILQHQAYHGRELVERIFQDINIIPNIVIEVISSESSRELARTGVACTLCDELLSATRPFEPDHGDYYSILIDHPYAKKDVFISYNKLYQLALFHMDFIKILADAFQ